MREYLSGSEVFDQGTAALGPGSQIVLGNLVVHREPGHEPLIGNLETQSFLEVDEQSLMAIEAIRATSSIHEAGRLLQAETGKELDILGLAEKLRRHGFVKEVDGQDCSSTIPRRKHHKFLNLISPSRLVWLHNGAFASVFSVLVGFWLLLVFLRPAVRPRSADLLIWNDPYLGLIFTLLTLLAVAYLHELGHFFMARSFNVDAIIGFSHRLLVLVLKTNVTNAWVLPARQRIWIFLAGMGVNLVLASTAGLLAGALQLGWLPGASEWIPLLRFFVAVNLLPLIYQLCIFARTDLYYVVAAISGERNLSQDSLAYLKYRLGRRLRKWKTSPEQACTACGAGVFGDDPFCPRCGDLRAVDDPNKFPFHPAKRVTYLSFGVLTLAGRAFSYSFFFLVAMPFLFRLMVLSYGALIRAWHSLDLGTVVLDTVILVALFAQAWASIYYVVNAFLLRTPRTASLSRMSQR